MRVKQSDKAALVETSHLKFPHDTHLKPGLKGPDGRETLKCASCHAPDSGRARASCRSAWTATACAVTSCAFEPAVTSRQVPHGSVEDAWLLIQEFYANVSLANVAVDTVDTGAVERRVPNASEAIVTEEQRRRALAFAQHKAQQVGADLFEKRVCVTCHDVRRSDAAADGDRSAAPWTVAPVHVAGTWLPHGALRPREAQDGADRMQGLPPRRALAQVGRRPDPRHRVVPHLPRRQHADRRQGRLDVHLLPRLPSGRHRRPDPAEPGGVRGHQAMTAVARILALAALLALGACGGGGGGGGGGSGTPAPGRRTC